MDITITPGKLYGSTAAIPSKSQTHRLLICSALADRPTKLLCPVTNRDTAATVACLNALGAQILQTADGYHVVPISVLPDAAVLPCRDSGSTLRFMLPIAAALGIRSTFLLEGRLPDRPLSPLWEELERMGCHLSRPSATILHCEGSLHAGDYQIDGGISSQFVTGLLFACSLLYGQSSLTLTGKIESRPYITMTLQAMSAFGVDCSSLTFNGRSCYRSPGILLVEGDWSNSAFFLAAGALGNSVTVTGLSDTSAQGDRVVKTLLPALRHHQTICAADIPDLVPILSIAAACNQGAVFTGIDRLRLKESDRVASIVAMVRALGGQADADEDRLLIRGTGLIGGCVDSFNDHRIAMSAAIAATVCREPVTILGAECVRKSHPGFFDEYTRLGGHYEFNLR